MQVIPAIDLQNGRCVRLFKGLEGTGKIYAEDPLEMLFYWEGLGAEFVHIIDLDGAFGKKGNRKIIKTMVETAISRIEIGGGIRTLEHAIELYSWGVERVIIGTAAIKDSLFISKLAREIGPKHIMVALDYRAEIVLIKGWKESSQLNIYELGKTMEQKGAGWILLSSAENDGTLGGPDILTIKKFSKMLKLPVIAAGGVSSLEDIKKIGSTKAAGVVIGKALYEKKFSYSEALELINDHRIIV
ncbi:MAG: 1-(5-phosphoribosyl)-5-[(5-phosphoribosylamino)methylideneamino]imidazole-4-carboxamide isomerase [Candidatus Helarchaeota archaeon]